MGPELGKVLDELDGVISADVSVGAGRAVVTYDPARTSPEALVSAINEQTGYRASVDGRREGIVLAVDGERDPGGISELVAALRALRGIVGVRSLSDGRLRITYDPSRTETAGIVAAVERLGYGVREVAGEARIDLPWYWPLGPLLALATILFLYHRRPRPRPDLESSGP